MSSKNGTLRTENDKDISNILNLYIVTYDKTSTKKDAYKVKQKRLTEDVDIICREDLCSNEVEIIFDEDDKADEKKSASNYISSNSSVSTQNDSIRFIQKFEYLMQVDIIYTLILKEIEEKNYDFSQPIENWFNLCNNNFDLIPRDVKIIFYQQDKGGIY